ncbi:MAG: outer membrane protein assembly factor BamE [Pseudomonadota bacterium]
MARNGAGQIAAVGLLAALVLSGCTPEIRTHGYMPPEEDLSQVRVGQDTRGSVRRKLGRPGASGIFTDDGWYYVASKVEHRTYHAPAVIERQVLAITFDDRDVVASIERLDLEDGRQIALEPQITPTYGRELTILEQAFGNIGIVTGNLFDE